jgi:type I restriction enzyme, S subunit
MSSKAKSTAMKKDGRPALTLKLRFPEFRNSEAWAIEPMERLYSFMRNNALSRDKLNYKVGTARNIHYGDIHTKFRSLFDITQETVPYINDTETLPPFDSDDYCVEGDLIFADASEDTNDVGKAIEILRLNGERLLSGQHTILARRKDERLIVGFGGHLFKSGQIRSQIMREAQGTKVYAISASRLGNIQVTFPVDQKEQQKIADCLDSVDELIAAQARKVDALKTHKKGLMHQLFPREGETQPRLRFPEFQDAGEWAQTTVGDISDVLMCKRIFAEETNPNRGVPFYKIGTLGGTPDAFISREKFDDYKSRYNYPRKGEVLITCSGTVGKCLPYDGKDAYFQDSNIVWLDNPKGEVSNEFLFILLSNVNWAKLNSTTITRIYGPDLRGVSIKFPEDEAEQQRIAECLTSLDDLIAAQTQKLDALKTHKKGLMQQLFPSMEEAR